MKKPPVDWNHIERIMLRVLGTNSARVSDIDKLTRAFRYNPLQYDAAHNRALAILEGASDGETQDERA